MNDTTRNISHLIELSRKILHCADRGDIQREDDTCGVLFGIARDCAYNMLGVAERERLLHIRKGSWDKDDAHEYLYPDEKTG